MSAVMDPIFVWNMQFRAVRIARAGFVCYGNAPRSGLSLFFVLAALGLFLKHCNWQAFVFSR